MSANKRLTTETTITETYLCADGKTLFTKGDYIGILNPKTGTQKRKWRGEFLGTIVENGVLYAMVRGAQGDRLPKTHYIDPEHLRKAKRLRDNNSDD